MFELQIPGLTEFDGPRGDTIYGETYITLTSEGVRESDTQEVGFIDPFEAWIQYYNQLRLRARNATQIAWGVRPYLMKLGSNGYTVFSRFHVH